MHIRTTLAIVGIVVVASASQAATIPRDAVIFPGRLAASLLQQCSRATPKPDGPSWQPSADEVLALETILPGALMAHAARGHTDWSKVTSAWRRQYVGIVVRGRRLIYGNYFPKGADLTSWRIRPAIVCDGGPAFFGVAYDVAAHRIVSLGFNGVA